MQIEQLCALNAASENLLRERAEEKGRDGDAVLRQIGEALAARKVEAVCLYDDAQVPCGIVVWRWPDRGQEYAQVLVFYIRAESPPVLSEALVDYMFSELARVRSLEVIEVRARDEESGARAVWQRHDFVFFERCRLVRPLGVAPVPVLPAPKDYRIVPWQDDFGDALERIAAVAYADSIESAAVPGNPNRRAIEQLLKTWTNEAEPPETNMSQFALDRRGQLIGYAAVSAPNGGAQVVDLAVLPAHRRRGVARALLVRSMTLCQRRGLDAVSVAVTTRNPARQLYSQLGFQAVDCGEVAIWWRDSRQLEWRE